MNTLQNDGYQDSCSTVKKSRTGNVDCSAAGTVHDQLIRTPKGWRITFRRLELYFADPIPIAIKPMA